MRMRRRIHVVIETYVVREGGEKEKASRPREGRRRRSLFNIEVYQFRNVLQKRKASLDSKKETRLDVLTLSLKTLGTSLRLLDQVSLDEYEKGLMCFVFIYALLRLLSVLDLMQPESGVESDILYGVQVAFLDVTLMSGKITLNFSLYQYRDATVIKLSNYLR